MATATATKPAARATTKPLKIKRLKISNFMRIHAEEIDLDGKSVVFSGPNGSGKTSAVLSILAGLGQVAGKEIPEPILRGEDRATVQLDLSDAESGKLLFVVVSDWTEAGRRVVVKGPDGSKVTTKNQEFLDSFLDFLCLVPFRWLSSRPQDQVDDVLRLCNVPVPVAEAEEITGDSLPAKADESAAQYLARLSADETGAYYVRRRAANLQWDQKKKALTDQQVKLDAMPEAAGVNGQDLGALLDRRKHLDQSREQARALLKNRDDVAAELAQAEAAMRQLDEDRKRSVSLAADLESQIQKLTAQLASARDAVAAVTVRLEKGQVTVAEIKADLEAAQAAVVSAPDPTPAILEVDRQIKAHQDNAAEIARRAAAEEFCKALQGEESEAAREHARADVVLTRLRELRRNLLNGVDLGVRGLEIGEGELRHNGVSFKQASQAQKITVAFALAIRRNPTARFILLDDAEHLDSDSRALVLKLAKDANVQAVLAIVRDGKELGFEIVG